MRDFYQDINLLFRDLAKSDQGLAGKIEDTYPTDNTQQQFPKHIYKDMSVPQMGNIYSFNQFKVQNPNCGVYILIDANDFNSINTASGHEIGNEAIKTLLGAISDAAKRYGLKAFRLAGACCMVHAPNTEHATMFDNDVQKAVAALPLVGGKHKMSVCIGMGYSPEHAQNALSISKRGLSSLDTGVERRVNPPGAEQTLSHSLLHESPNVDWRPLLGYSEYAPHEEMEPILPKEVKSPLRSDKG
jgi:hypothetical protein